MGPPSGPAILLPSTRAVKRLPDQFCAGRVAQPPGAARHLAAKIERPAASLCWDPRAIQLRRLEPRATPVLARRLLAPPPPHRHGCCHCPCRPAQRVTKLRQPDRWFSVRQVDFAPKVVDPFADTARSGWSAVAHGGLGPLDSTRDAPSATAARPAPPTPGTVPFVQGCGQVPLACTEPINPGTSPGGGQPIGPSRGFDGDLVQPR